MKKKQSLMVLLLSTSTVLAWSAGNAFLQAEHSCIKYPTPSARTECEKLQKEGQLAFDKELKRRKKEGESTTSVEAQANAKKKDGTCFNRESTGETVCPN